jgi:phage tail sheath protein FI
MPVTPTYPGVYIEEIPSGVRTITGVATSITAFIGYTVRGPVDKAIRIFNFGDFERTFGGLARNSEISYAIQQFYLNGGADAYVVRVAKNSVAAKVTLRDALGNDVLEVSAINPGVWGNNVRLSVDYATTNPDSTFNLAVTRYDLQNGQLVAVENERFINLSINSLSSTYALSVVNSASKLIRLARPVSWTLIDTETDNGYSLSGSLPPSTFPLTDQDKIITGLLDGVDPFTLDLTSPPPADIANIASLLDAVTNSIAADGLNARLEAKLVNALGDDSVPGDFLKLTSKLVGEFSSVQVTRATANDAAAKLRLGLDNFGREKEGASFHRPMPNGTTSSSLADILGTSVSGNIDVEINDQSNSSSPVAILSTVQIVLPPTTVDSTLATDLQELLRDIDVPATQQATVQLVGSVLQVLPSATQNASINLTDTGAAATRFTDPDAFENVQQYSLGGGADFGAQHNAIPGADGTPPDGATIIGNYNAKTGIYALHDVDLFNLMLIPRTTQLSDPEAKSVLASAIAFCEERRAFFLVDPDPLKTSTDIVAWASIVSTSRNAAVFFPQIQAADPLDGFRPRNMPASGAIAGTFARIDSQRGVWKAPAGTEADLRGVQGLSYVLTDSENGALNPKGVNALRNFPAFGNVIWGGRTMRGADQQADEYKYIPVRRLALFIEESLYRGTQWVVFEPNDEPLWAQIRLNVGAFMNNLFRQGAFQGKTPREAYFVKCDKETTTQNDINLGIVNILVGFAPLKPAEFVIIKLQQMAGQIQV